MGEARRKRALVLERKMLTREEIEEMVTRGGGSCVGKGCTEGYEGDQPAGWIYLVAYNAPRPVLDIGKIKPAEWRHDVVLCPRHARMLAELMWVPPDDELVRLIARLDKPSGAA